MDEGFYRALEERFRGSRALVRARLEVYRPFVALLARPGAKALDLGCGRGEWLEALGEAGFEAFGVDLDEGMLAACRERGLAVALADAVATLEGAAADSLAVVSAFHLVEHLPFALVRRIVAAALRALEPGGLLILETPNPENLLVAARDFYLDPSHVHPIPAALLAFVTEQAGFARTKVWFLQEDEALAQGRSPGLYEVLAGVSPDYAVVAQKGGAAAGLMEAFVPLFAAERGLGLEPLARRYDEALSGALQQVRGEVHEVGARVEALSGALQQVRAEVHEVRREVHEVSARVEALSGALQQVRAGVHEVHARVEAVYSSRSWRITAPLRAVGDGVREVRRVMREAVGVTVRAAAARPWLRSAGKALLRPFPRLRGRLLGAAFGMPSGLKPRLADASSVDAPYERRILALLGRDQERETE
jgi:O-antigen chain-terminating methyltransferase